MEIIAQFSICTEFAQFLTLELLPATCTGCNLKQVLIPEQLHRLQTEVLPTRCMHSIITQTIIWPNNYLYSKVG
jgi:hypothetical protein